MPLFLILRETQVNLSLFKYLHPLVHMGSHKKNSSSGFIL